MADRRVALYVYSKSTVTLAPSGTVDFVKMKPDYTAKFDTQITAPVTVDLVEGVYGYIYNGTQGVTAPSTVTVVDHVYDVAKKTPWPHPPPPPPAPFVGRTDWDDHREIFLAPLGADFDAPT